MYILGWNGKKVVNAFGKELVQLFDVKDINNDGNKELIIYSRYKGIHIYEFDPKIFKYVKKDEKYKKELKILNSPAKINRFFKIKNERMFY